MNAVHLIESDLYIWTCKFSVDPQIILFQHFNVKHHHWSQQLIQIAEFLLWCFKRKHLLTVIRRAAWHCSSKWVLSMWISQPGSVFIFNEVQIRKGWFTLIRWTKNTIQYFPSCCAPSFVLVSVHKTAEVWWALVGFEVSVTLQCKYMSTCMASAHQSHRTCFWTPALVY